MQSLAREIAELRRARSLLAVMVARDLKSRHADRLSAPCGCTRSRC